MVCPSRTAHDHPRHCRSIVDPAGILPWRIARGSIDMATFLVNQQETVAAQKPKQPPFSLAYAVPRHTEPLTNILEDE